MSSEKEIEKVNESKNKLNSYYEILRIKLKKNSGESPIKKLKKMLTPTQFAKLNIPDISLK